MIKRPIRRFEVATDSEGKRNLYYSVGPDDSLLDSLMTQGDVIRPNEIRPWLAPLKMTLPENDLQELVSILNLIRVTRNHPAGPSPERIAFARALAVISDTGTKLSEILDQGVAWGGPNASDFQSISLLIPQITTLVADVRRLQQDPLFMNVPKKRTTAVWHEDIDAIKFVLERAAERLGKPVSFTKDAAPAIEFIDKALKRAGVASSQPAVARAIGRRRKRPLPVHE
jgi:hypothetical protein